MKVEVSKLCRCEFFTDVQDEDGLTPLENGLEGLGTVYDKTMDVALYLLDRGFNDDTNRAKILCAACEYGDLDVVKKMIEEYKTEYKSKCDLNTTV